MPTPELVGVVAGCTAAGLAIVTLDSRVRARVIAHRHPNPWPKSERSNIVWVHHKRTPGEGRPFDWQSDDDWPSRRR